MSELPVMQEGNAPGVSVSQGPQPGDTGTDEGDSPVVEDARNAAIERAANEEIAAIEQATDDEIAAIERVGREDIDRAANGDTQ